MDKSWLKFFEVHQLLDISPGTSQNLRINGTRRFNNIGSILYYKADDIRAMLDGAKGK